MAIKLIAFLKVQRGSLALGYGLEGYKIPEEEIVYRHCSGRSPSSCLVQETILQGKVRLNGFDSFYFLGFVTIGIELKFFC